MKDLFYTILIDVYRTWHKGMHFLEKHPFYTWVHTLLTYVLAVEAHLRGFLIASMVYLSFTITAITLYRLIKKDIVDTINKYIKTKNNNTNDTETRIETTDYIHSPEDTNSF